MPSTSKKKKPASLTKNIVRTSKKERANITKASVVATAAVIVLAASFTAGRGYEMVSDQPQTNTSWIETDQQVSSFLFVQQALTGSFRPINAGSGTYRLTFVGVKPHTILLGDKPQRVVGSWTNTDYVTRWNQDGERFKQNPPNAILLSHSARDGKEYAVAVELSDPAFNGPAGTLTYTARVLSDSDARTLQLSADRHMDAFPEILRSPALIIDSAGVWDTAHPPSASALPGSVVENASGE